MAAASTRGAAIHEIDQAVATAGSATGMPRAWVAFLMSLRTTDQTDRGVVAEDSINAMHLDDANSQPAPFESKARGGAGLPFRKRLRCTTSRPPARRRAPGGGALHVRLRAHTGLVRPIMRTARRAARAMSATRYSSGPIVAPVPVHGPPPPQTDNTGPWVTTTRAGGAHQTIDIYL
jgi:hypothetical protein